jgi:predicted dehydrogenase
MTEPIRWGILGAASFARRVTGPAIHAARGAELAALATRAPEKADAFRAFAPRMRVHDSYAALLADPGIDAVYIPLPNTLHAEWTAKALAAGKAVLCEKPAGMSVGEIDAMIAARDASGLLAAEGFMIVHHPQWQLVRKLIADGAIGEVVHVDGTFTYDNRDVANIRNQAGLGGGGLRDIGVYPIGAARFALGAEPGNVEARVRYEGGVDVWVEATADLGPARFSFRVGTRAQRWQEITFHGTTGLIRVPAPYNPGLYGPGELLLIRPGTQVIQEPFTEAKQYELQVEAFGETMRTGAPFPVPLEWSRGTQAVIDAIFEAHPPPV